MESLEALVARLEKANDAYHNTATTLMTDAEYDRGIEELRRRTGGRHPFLEKIGASPSASGEGVKELPYKMASLNKVYPDAQGGGGALKRWCGRMGKEGATMALVMEKLDGLSALYVARGVGKKTKKELYLRGDGVKGVDVSDCIGSIPEFSVAGGEKDACVLRGELILSRANTPEGSIGRSLVNGWVHRGREERAQLGLKVEFLAYQILEPAGMTRQQQFQWLTARGYKTPRAAWLPWAAIQSGEALEKILKGWKTVDATYPIDGIVVAPANKAPIVLGAKEDLKNPTDAIAFKMILEDQQRETSVVDVLWAASPQGYLIPRLRVSPIEIGGATIEYCTAHNARVIADQKIEPGVRVRIRRGGDVIPTLDAVLVAGVKGKFPEDGTWEWVGDEGTATHIRVKGDGGDELIARRLDHCLSTLRVEGVGPGLVKKMVEAGLKTARAVYDATEDKLCALLGPGRGKIVYAALRAPRDSWREIDFMIASSALPRGVGERKMRVLFERESNPRRWVEAIRDVPEGWTTGTLEELFKSLEAVFRWRDENFGWCAPAATVQAPTMVQAVASAAPKGVVVFSGVRDKALEAKLMSEGWVVEDSITKKTTMLVVADGEQKETGKVKKAREAGIQIKNISSLR